MPRAFSYVRFSTPEQRKGDSLRRQLAASEAYAEAHGLVLDDTLNMRDLGVSAFKGAHRTKGALATFLKEVEIGAIPPGSVLIVESLDRLSREQVLDAQHLFTSIIRAGIKVVTLLDGMEYDEASINANFPQLIVSLIVMSRAHEESLTKSKRLKEVWAARREKAAQGFGIETITRKLNADSSIWRPQEHHANTGGWRKSYVEKILHSRAVIGEYQPHKMVDGQRQPEGAAIPDYFPVVVDKDLFYRVQAAFARNASIPGRGGGATGAINNIFGHIAKCARCGGAMCHVNKGVPPKGGQYLQCDLARRGLGCDKTLLRYDRLESMLLHLCRGLDPQDLLTDQAEKAREEARLNQRRQAIEGEIGHLDREVNNLVDQISRTDSVLVRQLLDKKLSEKLARQTELKQALASLETKEVHTPEAVAQHLANVEDLIQRMEQLQGDELGDLRRRLRHALHQLIDRIDLEPGPHNTKISLAFKDSGTLYLVLDAKGALRLAQDGTKLYILDGDGNVLDVAPDLDHSAEVEHSAKGLKVNKLVAEALKRRTLDPHMTAAGCGRPPP